MSTEAQRDPIYAIAVDGPREQPNGHLLVEIIRQDQIRHRFECRVIEVMPGATGRTSQAGDIFVTDAIKLFLCWRDKT